MTEATEELFDWVVVGLVMWMLWIMGTALNNTVTEFKRLGTETPGHCVWHDWQEGCS